MCDCNEARRMLETQLLVQAVVTDTALPDGDWRRVVRECPNIEVVVCSRLDDPTLWLDVLELGGYDVLVQPYQREEINELLKALQPEAIFDLPPEAIMRVPRRPVPSGTLEADRTSTPLAEVPQPKDRTIAPN